MNEMNNTESTKCREDPLEMITNLACTFPSLREAMGGRPFDLSSIEAIAEGATEPSGRAAAKFILDVWNLRQPGRFHRFDLVEAMLVFDNDHREAFEEWVLNPCFPSDWHMPVQKRPRLWKATEALRILDDYLSQFPTSLNSAARDRLWDLVKELEWLEEHVVGEASQDT